MSYLSGAIARPPQTGEASAAVVPAVPWLAYGYGLVVALTLGHFLLGLPIQLSDSFGQMLKLTGPWSDLLYGEFTQRGYMRPLMWGELKLVYDMSGGNYFAWFRGAHVIEVVLVVLLYVRLVRPRTYLDLMVLPLGLAVLVGLHTFQGTVREAFPLNHFLTVLIYTLLAANLLMSRPPLVERRARSAAVRRLGADHRERTARVGHPRRRTAGRRERHLARRSGGARGAVRRLLHSAVPRPGRRRSGPDGAQLRLWFPHPRSAGTGRALRSEPRRVLPLQHRVVRAVGAVLGTDRRRVPAHPAGAAARRRCCVLDQPDRVPLRHRARFHVRVAAPPRLPRRGVSIATIS